MFGTPSVKMVVGMLFDAERRKPGTTADLAHDVARELGKLPPDQRAFAFATLTAILDAVEVPA
jgi:hypothetical protein